MANSRAACVTVVEVDSLQSFPGFAHDKYHWAKLDLANAKTATTTGYGLLCSTVGYQLQLVVAINIGACGAHS